MKLSHGVGVMTGGKKVGLSEEPRPGGWAGRGRAWMGSMEALCVDCESSHNVSPPSRGRVHALLLNLGWSYALLLLMGVSKPGAGVWKEYAPGGSLSCFSWKPCGCQHVNTPGQPAGCQETLGQWPLLSRSTVWQPPEPPAAKHMGPTETGRAH